MSEFSFVHTVVGPDYKPVNPGTAVSLETLSGSPVQARDMSGTAVELKTGELGTLPAWTTAETLPRAYAVVGGHKNPVISMDLWTYVDQIPDVLAKAANAESQSTSAVTVANTALASVRAGMDLTKIQVDPATMTRSLVNGVLTLGAIPQATSTGGSGSTVVPGTLIPRYVVQKADGTWPANAPAVPAGFVLVLAPRTSSFQLPSWWVNDPEKMLLAPGSVTTGGTGGSPTLSVTTSYSEATPGQVVVTWTTTATPAAGWIVSRDGVDSYGTNGWTATVATGTRAYMFTELIAGSTYNFRVSDATAGSTMTAAATFTIPKSTPVPGTSGGWLSGADGIGVDNQRSGMDNQFAQWRGSPLTILRLWGDTDDSNQRHIPALTDGFPNWQASIDVACGFITADESMYDAASGACDGRWKTMLQTYRDWWQSRSNPSACIPYLSPAHEFNGDNYPWMTNRGNAAQFITGWKRFRTLQKSIFPQARLVLCANRESWGNDKDNWTKWVPGAAEGRVSDYIDCGGVDYYNQYPHINSTSEWGPVSLQTDGWGGPKGIEAHRKFWESKGLGLIIGEWSNNASEGEGDVYVKQFNAWCRANGGRGAGKLEAEIFFNQDKEGGVWHIYGGSTCQHPKFRDAYRSLTWGS